MPKTKSIMLKIGDKWTNGKDIYICDYEYKRKRKGRPPYRIFIKQENKGDIKMKYYYIRNVETNIVSNNWFTNLEKAKSNIKNENEFVEEIELDGIMRKEIYQDIMKQLNLVIVEDKL